MADLQTTQDGFNTLDIGAQPYNPNIPIDDRLLQALVRLMGFDANNKTWRTLKTDSDGRLYVSTAPVTSANVSQSNPTVGVAQVVLLGANPNRKVFIIQNLGAAAIYLGFGINITTVTGLQIPAGGNFIDDHFNGVVNAISGTAGQDVRVVEF